MRSTRWSWLSFGALAVSAAWLALLPMPGCSTLPLRSDTAGRSGAIEPMVALWVTRWDYRQPEDVERIVADAAALGVTDLLWQVRGQGDAYYASDREPWGEELLADLPPGTSEPGFDPLTLAIQRAHASGIRLHAWVNVMPLWKGVTPPKSKDHPWHLHPEWRLRDARGTPQPLGDGYVIANPALDSVQDHIVGVCRDLVDRYDLDGLHLDYVRFIPPTGDQAGRYLRDTRTLSLFRRTTGRGSVQFNEDEAAFRSWIRDRITQLVTRIRAEAVDRRPGVVLSAAVWRRPDIARETYLQDAVAWLQDGTIDRAMPMIYTDDDEQFVRDLRAWHEAVPGADIVPGIGVYKHRASQTPMQISLVTGRNGFALFGYASIFESINPGQDRTEREVLVRAARRRALADTLALLRAVAIGR